ncbi:hypothetical protein BDW59DRAFT_147887 [Aspergillus cavernicola]|uniref:Uncharacterized protein n=1 Tax=Aspergillus cavernicola TaxID=176166 RepID=A0ABR4I8S3_9EURO
MQNNDLVYQSNLRREPKMASMNTCDSPDLWVKIKAAKEGLMKDKHFSSKYKTSPVSSIEAAVKQVQRRPGLSEVPASKEVVKEVVLLNTTNNLNQCQKPAPSSPPANLAYCPNPTVNSTNTKRSRPMPCILCTRSEAIARRLISATPLAPNRTTLMSLEDPIDYASCIPSPLANEVNDLDSSESSWGRAAADTPGRALVTDVHSK